jgi:hypothetical protein
VNAILSLKNCEVNVVECGYEVVHPQENTKKKLELRKTFNRTTGLSKHWSCLHIDIQIGPSLLPLHFFF